MPRTILVVDDELFGLRKIHVEGAVGNFYDVLADTTDPVFASLWEVAQSIPVVSLRVPDVARAAEYFSTDDAVRDLLLSAEFAAGASATLKELLATFLARAQRVAKLHSEFLIAFPQPEFVGEFCGAPRPPPSLAIGAPETGSKTVLR